MVELLKFTTNSYNMNDLDTCELRWALNRELFKQVTRQNNNDIPGNDFEVFGRYAHTMFRLFCQKNFQSSGSFAGTATALWAIYLDQVDMYERHPKGVAGYTPKIRSMMEEFYGFNYGERTHGTIGFEVPGRATVNTGRYLVGVGGRIDRLWKRNGREVATDYKTTTQRKTEHELREENQFIIHSLMRKTMTGEFPEIEVYYPGFTVGNRSMRTEIITFQLTEDDIKNFRERLNEQGNKRSSVLGRMNRKERIDPEYSEGCFLCKYAVTGFCDEYTGNNKNGPYKSPLRVAPRRFPIKKIKKRYQGLVKLKNFRSRKYYYEFKTTDTGQISLFHGM